MSPFFTPITSATLGGLKVTVWAEEDPSTVGITGVRLYYEAVLNKARRPNYSETICTTSVPYLAIINGVVSTAMIGSKSTIKLSPENVWAESKRECFAK